MFFWYVGLSVVIVYFVFQSSGIDYRLVALGSLLPLGIDAPFRRLAYGHTLVCNVALLVVVMVATIGRSRLLRRRVLCLPIGALCGLLVSGAWTSTDVFWWPFTGTTIPQVALLPNVGVVLVEELVGIAVALWLVQRFGLTEPERRHEFLQTGRLREPASS